MFRDQIKRIQGDKIREVRKHYGLSQEGFAKTIGCEKTTLSFYETGQRMINTDTLFAIWKAYGISPDMMLGIRPIKYQGKINPLQMCKDMLHSL